MQLPKQSLRKNVVLLHFCLCVFIKQGLQKYRETIYSRCAINQMWLLKNSKELLDYLTTNINFFDFSTLYTTIPLQKLKSRQATIIRNSFIHKNGNQRYKYLVLGREGPYCVKEYCDSMSKYTEKKTSSGGSSFQLTKFLLFSQERFSNR